MMNSGRVKNILKDSGNSKNSKDVKRVDSEDSDASKDSGDSLSEYTDSDGSADFEADLLSACEEVFGAMGREVVKIKDFNNLKVFEVVDKKSKNEKAKISKNRVPITIFDHILIFTLLFVFAGILTVTGYSDDVFKWIHEKTGVSWQNFGGKNWIQ